MRLSLQAETRKDFKKSYTKKLRNEGKIPATLYGKGIESKSLQLDLNDMVQLLRTPGGRLALIDLKVDGKAEKAHPVMIQTIQREPIGKKIRHVDFHRISMNEPVTAVVPITLLGEAAGQSEGGVVEQPTSDLHVKALPDHIPTHIDVDITHLALGDSVHVADIQVAEGVEIVAPPAENVVVMVRLPHVRVEAAVPAAEEVEAAPEEAAAPAAEEETAEGPGGNG
jgi:large subunit ribosomal protein L25